MSANTTSGFSILTYTGNNTNGATVGHGLGVTPDMLIIKARSTTTGWSVNHVGTGMTSGYLQLQSTAAFASAANNVTGISSSTFTLGVDSWVNASGQPFICYAFNSVEGFSKFGSYTGNGSSDGPLVYTGFRVGWLMVKRTDDAFGWYIHDAVRDPFNHTDSELVANSSGAEYSREGAGGGEAFDFVANGFKVRTANTALNASGGTYIYMAFAEQPFKFSNAR